MRTLWNRELEFLNVLKHMENRGVLIDKPLAKMQYELGRYRCEDIKEDLRMDPGKSSDLKKLLIDEMGLPVVKQSVKTGNPSFDKAAMEDYELLLEYGGYNKEIASMILEYRGWQRTCSSNYKPYLEKCGPDGRVRTHYNLHRTVTSRLSSSDPNFHNIPRNSQGARPWNIGVKECFMAPVGYTLVEFDYSQLEFRAAAAYAEDDVLLDAFNGYDNIARKRDVFTEMSIALDQDRQDCKTFTYAKLYGALAKKLAFILGKTVPEGQVMWNDWNALYYKLVDLSDQVHESAKKKNYTILWTGRRRHYEQKYETRKAFNSLLQGGGAEIVKSAMIRMFNTIDNPECRMLLTVHDSVVWEIKTDMVDHYSPIILAEMSNVIADIDDPTFYYTDFLARVNFDCESKVWR